tara:strand:- start:898 stop:1194 length:297 start_codon:yes stop_codon:yes gene_type:complete
MTIHYTNAGNHRGNVRAWLENSKLLNEHGFAPNTRYRVIYADNAIILCVDPDGPRKVSNTFKGPIIDLNNSKMNHYDFSNGIQWSFTNGQIVITERSE